MSALSKWMACFGCREWLINDQSSNFIGPLMTNIIKEAQIRHQFTAPYCPWSNGTVEPLCNEVLRIAKALLSEWELPAGHWPAIVEVVQKVINQSPLNRLGKASQGKVRCPMEIFKGLRISSSFIRSTL